MYSLKSLCNLIIVLIHFPLLYWNLFLFSLELVFLSWYRGLLQWLPLQNSTASNMISNTSMNATSHGVNPSLFLFSNMASTMTLKLDYNNYLIQRHQSEVILEAYSMINFIKDTTGALNPNFLKHSSENYTTEANPKFIHQRNHEQALFAFINSILFQSPVSPFRKNAFFSQSSMRVHEAVHFYSPANRKNSENYTGLRTLDHSFVCFLKRERVVHKFSHFP